MSQVRKSRARAPRSNEDIATQLAAIHTLPRATLIERWTAAYGRPPPKGLSRRLLEYAAAYQLQARVFGDLKPAIRRELLRYAESRGGTATVTTPPKGASPLAPGSRLIREWHGRTYTVDVHNTGFLWDGRRYRSLSEIARAITGSRWSGPKFFGL